MFSDSTFIVPNGVTTLYINLTGSIGGNGQNVNVLYSNSTSVQYALTGCSGGSAVSADLILNCNPGDSILISFGNNGVTLPTNTVNSIYSSISGNGTNGGLLQLSINSLNVLSISGGLGGNGITYNGMNFNCWSPPGADGQIVYPSAFSTYPIFVVGSRISSTSNQITIKY